MKKTLALILALSMLMGVMSFAAAEGTYNMPEMNTTDEITLSFMTWDHS